MKNRVISFIAYLFAMLIYFTLRKKVTLINEIPKEPIIYTYWHGTLLYQPLLYKLLKLPYDLYVMISKSKDGEIIANAYALMGARANRGSSSRGGAAVLKASINEIKSGNSIGITPDGPRGPIHEIKDGAYGVAKVTKAKLVVASIIPTRFWRVNSWDQFIIPKPFSTLNVYFETVDISELEKVEANKLLHEKLMCYVV